VKTHGPRMNRVRTREVLDKLAIPVVKSDGLGIEIHRQTVQAVERWRLQTGGGIAGNSDKVWLSPVTCHTPTFGNSRGPYWNKTQLEKALRAWRRGE
jgi:hypothetical protein